MSEWIDIPLATQQADDQPVLGVSDGAYTSEAELTNLMLRRNPPGTRTPFHIANTPGLSVSTFTTPGAGRIRGICKRTDDVIFLIRGTTAYYSSDTCQSWTSIGTVAGTGFCRMTDAGTHIVAVDGVNAYGITTSAATACSRGNFCDVTYQDGFTVYAETGSNSLYTSNVDDPLTIDPLNFTTVDAGPGNLLAVVSDHREVFAFKHKSIEQYYDAGTAGFPFARSSPGFLENGLPVNDFSLGAINTVAKYDHHVFWVNHNNRIYTMQGLQPTVISAPWVEKYIFGNYPTGTGASPLFGMAYVLEGVLYYAVGGLKDAGTAQRVTLVYDTESGVWHKRFTTAGTGYFITNIIECPLGAQSFDGVIAIVNDFLSSSGSIQFLSHHNTGDVSGAPARTMVVPQIAPANGARTIMHELYLDMKKSADTLSLSWSDDGGLTYSSAHAATVSVPRTRWQRLGSFFQRILKFTFGGANAVAIMGARARITRGVT